MNDQTARLPALATEPVELDDWAGRWITHPDWVEPPSIHTRPLPVLGLDLDLPDDIASATLAWAGVGAIDIEINGQPASSEVLAPGYATYSRRVPARRWDVTAVVLPGANTIRVLLGTGIAWVEPGGDRYTKLVARELPPRFIGQLTVRRANGDTTTIATGTTWRTTDGPVQRSHWYGGEDVDLRSTAWARSTALPEWIDVTDLGPASLHATWWPQGPGLAVTGRVEPVAQRAVGEGSLLLDFGANRAGWPVLHCPDAAAGTRLEIWPSEVLTQDGRVDQRTTGSPLWDSVVLADGPTTWHPRHVYHGFRYLEVRGEIPADTTFEAWVIHAGNRPVGKFHASDEFLNTIDLITDRAVRSNMYSVFTDCPNREKLGWVEQLHLCFGALARCFDIDAHMRDELQHLRDAQLPTGLVPSIAPEAVDFSNHEYRGDPDGFRDDPNWGSAIVRLTEQHYLEYGDPVVLDENWDAITKYLGHLDRRADEGLVDFGLGDWIEEDDSTPRALVATYGYIRALLSASRIRRHMGVADEARALAARAEKSLSDFRQRFSNDGGSWWGSGSQASYALALDVGAVPSDRDAAAFSGLLDAIAAADTAVTTGEVAWPALVDVLHAHHRDDLVYAMMSHPSRPGYAMQLRLGATSLTERWIGALGVEYDNSQNHFMLGMIIDWMRGDIAGLRQAPESIGWQTALVHPTFLPPLRSASTTYDSPRGRYHVEWNLDPAPRVTVEVPPEGSARVELNHLDGRAFSSAQQPSATHPHRTEWVVTPGRWEFLL